MSDLVAITQDVLGPALPLDHQVLAKIGEDAVLDRQIVQLSQAGLPYPSIAEVLDIPLPDLLRRISSLLTTRDNIRDSGTMDEELRHQLRLLGEIEASSIADMQAQADGEITESVASKTRHNGRLSLIKALQQRSVITGLIRKQEDTRAPVHVSIAIMTKEQLEAL